MKVERVETKVTKTFSYKSKEELLAHIAFMQRRHWALVGKYICQHKAIFSKTVVDLEPSQRTIEDDYFRDLHLTEAMYQF